MKRFWFAALIILPFLISCPTGASFSDLEGFNLLSTDERALDPALWTIDYGLETPPDFAYMTFDPSLLEAGPSTGDTVSRVEIVNLMPNGDFRGTLSDWTAVGGPTYGIVSEKLDYTLDTQADRINFDLSSIYDGLVANAGYFIRFDLKSETTTSYFQYTNPVQLWKPPTDDLSLTYAFPADFDEYADASFTSDSTTNIFTIGTDTGSGGAMGGTIDNLRVVRTDITSCIVLDVPLTSAGRPDLVSGTYRFTVYVKNDPGVPITPNRMPAAAICLAVTSGTDASVSSLNASSFEASSAWSEWTAYSVSSFIQVDEGAETALRLRISPTNTVPGSYGRDVGSLLISSPILEYSSTGSF